VSWTCFETSKTGHSTRDDWIDLPLLPTLTLRSTSELAVSYEVAKSMQERVTEVWRGFTRNRTGLYCRQRSLLDVGRLMALSLNGEWETPSNFLCAASRMLESTAD
jgi:hypothetical protein